MIHYPGKDVKGSLVRESQQPINRTLSYCPLPCHLGNFTFFRKSVQKLSSLLLLIHALFPPIGIGRLTIDPPKRPSEMLPAIKSRL